MGGFDLPELIKKNYSRIRKEHNTPKRKDLGEKKVGQKSHGKREGYGTQKGVHGVSRGGPESSFRVKRRDIIARKKKKHGREMRKRNKEKPIKKSGGRRGRREKRGSAHTWKKEKIFVGKEPARSRGEGGDLVRWGEEKKKKEKQRFVSATRPLMRKGEKCFSTGGTGGTFQREGSSLGPFGKGWNS